MNDEMPAVFRDITTQVPGYLPKVIFDIGANVGLLARRYARVFPDCDVYAFEPAPPTFERMRDNAVDLENVRPFALAFGASSGVVPFVSWPGSTTNRVVKADSGLRKVREVPMTTGALFCAEHGVEAISFLKIDTEGYDLEVLSGFGTKLGGVDFIQVEASMNDYNKTHVRYRLIEDFLAYRGFQLFKIYEQYFEGLVASAPLLRRANPVFINARITEPFLRDLEQPK